MKVKDKIKITGGQINRLLLDLDFYKRKLGDNVVYEHDGGAVIIFKNIRWNEYLSQKTFCLISETLHGYGLSNENTFSRTITL